MVRIFVSTLAVGLAVAVGSVTAAPLKGDGPTVIRGGYGAVWIGTGGGWQGGGLVLRIDPRRSRVVHRVRVYGFVHGLVPAFASVWVASAQPVLQRIDVKTGRVRRIWSRDGWKADSVAVAAGRMWMLDRDGRLLWRVDPARNAVGEPVGVQGGDPLTLWADGSRLWLAVNVDPKPPLVEDNLAHVRLVALDPVTGRRAGPMLDTAGWVSFAVGFHSLWASDPVGESLSRIDPVSGATLAAITSAQAGYAGFAAFGSLWLPTGQSVDRIDPATLSTVASVPVRASAVAAASGAVWVMSWDGDVARIDPRTNQVVARLEVGAKA